MSTPPKFAAALATDEDLQTALDHACRDLGSKLNETPAILNVYVSADRNDSRSMEQISRRLYQEFNPDHLLGCAGESIVGGIREIEMAPALSIWATSAKAAEVESMHLTLQQSSDGAAIVGWPEQLSADWPADATLLLLGDPYSFPADVLVSRLNDDQAGVAVVGGMASAGNAVGENQLMLDDQVYQGGAVALLLHGRMQVRTLVSQGCRPIGQHFVITRAEKNVIHELGGRPALLRLKEVFDQLATREQQMVQQGLHVGRVVSEYQDHFEQGDFLVRNVMGIDPNEGSIAIADYVRPGQTVQFHIRDEQTADHELRQLLGEVAGDESVRPQGGLLFTCNGRGTRLFSEADHDASAIHDVLGELPLAGFFAAGEIGPVGGKNFTHGFTASLALFYESSP